MQSLQTNVGIAWSLVSDFNQIDSLFKDQKLPYKVITHVCIYEIRLPQTGLELNMWGSYSTTVWQGTVIK